MAGQTTITRYMDAIGAIARAFSWNGTDAGSGTVYLGGTPVVTVKPGRTRYADTENWEALIRTLTPVPPTAPPAQASPVQSYFSYWLQEFEFDELELKPAQIVGELAVFVPKDVTSDMNAAWDHVLNFVANGIGAQANYDSGNYTPLNVRLIRPGPIRVKLYKSDDTESGGVTLFDFGAYGGGGITIPDP